MVLSKRYDIVETIKNIIRAAFFQGNVQIGGAMWFFQTLFIVLIIYTIIEFLIRKKSANENSIIIIQTIMASVFLVIGYKFHLENKTLYGLERVFSVYSMIHLGRLIKCYGVMERLYKRCKGEIWIIISFIILLLGYHRGYIALDGNNIENPFFFILMSMSGWILLYSISCILKKYNLRVNKGLMYISQHSIPIIALHFLCFKLVNYLEIIFYHMPKYMIAAFPVLISNGLWWIIYTVIGIGVPLLLRIIILKIYKIVK